MPTTTTTTTTPTRGGGTATVALQSAAPLWITRDGGAQWRKTGLHGVVAFALGARAAYAVTGSCSRQGCDHLALHRFDSSTGRWTALPSPITSVTSAVSMTANSASVWISAAPSGSAAGPRLWASSDRGARFVKRPAPCPATAATVAAASASALWALCAGKTPTLHRSVDAGALWTPVAVPAALSATAAISPTGPAAMVLATGTSHELLRTSDGGKTFQKVSPKGIRGRWILLQFAASRSGGALLLPPATTAATRQGVQLWRSTDAGASWTGPARFRS